MVSCIVLIQSSGIHSEIFLERIRNTLSHEMCHLACWVIDGELTEAHGSIWRGWLVLYFCFSSMVTTFFDCTRCRATKVMRKRPDIQVAVRVFFLQSSRH